MIYTVAITFESDRPLTEYQKEMLLGSIELQVQEPQNYEGEGLEYGTVVQQATIKGEGE